MRILIIEDDRQTAEFLSRGLQEAGFRICCASDGLEGLRKARTEPFDLAVVDLMLPKLDGLSVIEEIRAGKNNMPIIVLSARDSVEDKISGLEKGGDDYLSKPFSFGELLARIQALLRRAAQMTEPTTLMVGDLELDLLTRRVTRGGEPISLQPLEFQLLEYLMRNRAVWFPKPRFWNMSGTITSIRKATLWKPESSVSARRSTNRLTGR